VEDGAMNRKSTRTHDGVTLSCLEGGAGHPLVMLPGWSQSAAMYERQFEDFCRIARVIALDHRGHGESDKPDHGYRVQRLAKDLYELIDALQLVEPDILAHSMGAAVTWSYLSLFGPERPPRRLIFVDEPRALLARPDWSKAEREEAGAIVPSLEALSGFVAKVRESDSLEAVADILRPMFTAAISEAELLDIARENLKLPRSHAAELLADNVIQDWRRLIEQIRCPTLVFGGAGSIHPAKSQRWIAGAIPGAELDIVPADEGGNHFLFYENPARFNERVARFLQSSAIDDSSPTAAVRPRGRAARRRRMKETA
jgi:pimeloyl-ACP methyl ester carboxylesterase